MKHKSNITQTEQVIFRNICIYICTYDYNKHHERRGHEFQRKQGGIWENLEAGNDVITM